ncbi:SusC/RagA family TonB-linked outer membrane protein [Rapidithrix thailandica]|uniref:SusC/RagA family TonB-linked outer membrane protein n=1 Tax=Rapidithrix thailandica TaxID=413964 RepID=A0AAW9SAN2_9BACT
MSRFLLVFGCLCAVFSSAWAQSRTVTGTVTGAEDNGPLPGVSILVKGTTKGTVSDVDGNYSLSIPESDAILVFSYVGFKAQEVAVGSQSQIDVALEYEQTELNEVVVTALGIQREEKSLGYAVTSVSAKDLVTTGSTNFGSALYGKAAGVKISTAPGGATSAVNVQIRGVNSLNYNTQPLYVVDGVQIRNSGQSGSGGINNGGYWNDQKIRGNGLLDINPEDIESLTVLKGASATALYGSEAANGVIVITTKKGTKQKGLGVDVNYTHTIEEVAFTPKYQNVYGPGYDRETNFLVGADEDGWIHYDSNGDGVNDAKRPNYRAYGQFGPKMDGQTVEWWDGSMRSYSAQPDNFKELFEKGHSSTLNAAISNQSEKGAFRLSYTRTDYKAIQRNSNQQKNIFNLNSTLKLNKKLSVDLVASYINTEIHNRPELINRVVGNYDGFFSRADDMSVYLDKYQTSEGYKYVPYNLNVRNPEEALKHNIRAGSLMDYMWRNFKNSEDELQNRLISSMTINYDINSNLKLRGRIGNDFTSTSIEKKEYNEYSSAFNQPTSSTGSYNMAEGRYSIVYGDALLTYSKEINSDIKASVSGGLQGRHEKYLDQSTGTRSGLVLENWFSINNSFNATLDAKVNRGELIKYAYLGIANFSFRDYLFIEGTVRQEYSSSLPAKNNSYFYPSVNAGFVFTEAFTMPTFMDYGKLRASYGIVGNSPQRYLANIAYSQSVLQTSTNGSVPSLSADTNYGNEDISPEQKFETEFGLELSMLNSRLGLDVTYYFSRVEDQLLQANLAPSTGATSRLYNVGELRSKGIEVAINSTPVMGTVRWDARFNFAINRTKVHKLAEGIPELVARDLDGGAVQVKADEGDLLGNIYVHPRATDEDGNYIIGENGLYVIDQQSYVKAGNVQPKVIGGFANTVSYKGFSLDMMIDYRLGGQIVSTPLLYGKNAGMYENTLAFRDEANGGLPYYIDANNGNKKVLLSNHNEAAPDGSRVYHNGMVLNGVTADGKKNTTVVDAPAYYMNSYGWSSGWYEDGAVYDNSFVKLREVALTYHLPKDFVQKIKLQRLSVSLIGRNLFYIYRTLDNLDPEAPVGSHWSSQGIDEGSTAANRSYGFSLRASF